ncbi:PilT/PilU family type 4a pilus ATPase [Pseudomonas sp. N040]|uniref:PilT/PilU family type 4a pilus ATPase n=1 Tax=Pseudomonas sp. N040 TaxID=2785325 RepID=UPI0018A2DB1A|nr:PilT/PilU family type 4a pilus ATPase [Pseudomonas sp. N040]MBF7728950.1 PilT/PilU family type 4a pilus ATPase [Pseudomonas sp. N040]MBW7012590.1 PilT/PilU family type 4a pilus ATPase [Pseudomonas sp. N040]
MENQTAETPKPDAYNYLQQLYEQGGSDLFLSVGTCAQIKVEGITRPLNEYRLRPGEVQLMAYQLMNQRQIAEFERDLEMNLAVSVSTSARFRINVYYQRGEVSMAVRLIQSRIPSIIELGLPAQLQKLAMLDRGLVLVVGAAGSGKSTTLAAMLDHRNQHKSGHIICIEDPIEYIHQHKLSVIDQREVGLDTHSFSAALRNVLREAPDVIMLGEIRDLDTMQNALHYAETGHLCLATLHATSTTHALERIVRFFPEDARHQVLADLAQNLLAIVGQRLIPAVNQRRAVAVELMLATAHIRDLIQRDLLDDLREAIGRAQEQGLQTFDQHLFLLYQAGKISIEEALRHADSRTDLTLRIKLGKQVSGNDLPFHMQDSR